jgi:uncharacterized protein (TIGR02646 family)
MKPSVRPDCPSFLAENWRQWGEEYAARRMKNPSYRFNWKKWQETPVNQLLLEPLSEMTDGHCAYCDWFPTDCGTDQTIDHFKPKTKFPKEAYYWPNLYLACRQCQKKSAKSLSDDQYEQLLRPDASDYEFECYFIYNFLTGDIEPNPAAEASDRERAELTIRTFQLNAAGRPAARKRMLAQFQIMDQKQRDEYRQYQPFRYLLPA